jgi:hypothetical protein
VGINLTFWEEMARLGNKAVIIIYMLSDFADQLAKKYLCPVSAVLRDWKRRKQWMPLVATVEDPELHIATIMLRFQTVSDACWVTYRMAKKAGNVKAMNGAIGELTRLLKHEVDVLQSLGVLHVEPERLDAQITQFKAGPMPGRKSQKPNCS